MVAAGGIGRLPFLLSGFRPRFRGVGYAFGVDEDSVNNSSRWVDSGVEVFRYDMLDVEDTQQRPFDVLAPSLGV
jgi:hypothetical protein